MKQQDTENMDYENSNYVGISFVDLNRVEALIKSTHFISRNFSDAEQQACKLAIIPSYTYAQFLAAKIACFKAMNIDFYGQYKLCNLELTSNESEAFLIQLHGKIEYDTRLLGIEKLLVSFSRNKDNALATVACVTKYNKREIVEEISIKDELNAAFKDLRQVLD